MKFRKLLGGGLLAAVLALGGVAGLATRSESEAVKADDAVYTGNVIIQKNDDDMKYTGSKLVAYLFNGSANGWTTAVWNTANKYQEINWSLSFEPTTIIVLRVDGANWNPSDPWKNVWSRTGNVSLSEADVIYMWGNASESGSGYGTFVLDSVVRGGASDDWKTETITVPLTHKKTDGNKIEAYGDVYLPADSYFKVVRPGDETYPEWWIGNYTAHESIEDFFDGGGDSNIHNSREGTYEFYFDFEGCTTYITDPDYAAADEWAQSFKNGVTCSGSGSILTDNWSTLSGTYSLLSDKSKGLFEAVKSHGKEDGTYIEQAIARYDYILIKYGIGTTAPKHTDFIGRFATGGINQNVPTAQAPISVFGSMDNSTPIMLVVIISVVSLTAVGGYIFLKRRKED